MEKEHEILLNVTDYTWYRFLFGKIQISFNHKKTFNVRFFTVLLIFFLLFDCLTILLILEIRFSLLLLNTW